MIESMWTPKDIMERLGISRTQLDRMIKTGAIPPPIRLTLRGWMMWRPETIEAWMAEKGIL